MEAPKRICNPVRKCSLSFLSFQKFVGALHGKRAKKGVFINTGKFSDDSKKYVETIDPKVILIDGRTLAELMIDFNLGTTTSGSYEIKRIDSDYYAEE